MTWGDLLEEEMERADVDKKYVCSPTLYNVSADTMRASSKKGGGDGKYLFAAPPNIIKAFRDWLRTTRGEIIENKTNVQIMHSWRIFLNSTIA